jgi:antibiotic biosynthesis monooxygenase (ABM) superfamily enzyme
MTDSLDSGRSVVTRIIAYNVRLGHDAEFQSWQKSINDKTLKFPGALRIDVLPSNLSDSSHEWIVVYRFHTEDQLRAWLCSPERKQAMARAPDIFTGTETEYTLAGAEAPDASETIVTSNEVIPGKEADYEAADTALNDAAARFPGFAGAKVFKPRPESRTWSTMIRFDSKANMDRWLASPERAAGRQRMYQFTASHHANVVPTGFGSWFAINAEDGIAAPAWKQAMTVLAALFPTVMILNMTVGNLVANKGAPMAVNVFIGNTLGTIALTWLLMPVVTRLMAWWLSPGCPPNKTAIGVVLLLGIYGVELILFTRSWVLA